MKKMKMKMKMKNNPHQHIIDAALAQAARLREAHGPASIIRLSLYETDGDIHALRPEDGPEATAAGQREIVEAIAQALTIAGHNVELTTLRAANYLRWLASTGNKNTPANRAQWLSLQS